MISVNRNLKVSMHALCGLALYLSSFPSNAGSYVCTGSIDGLSQAYEGTINLSSNQMYLDGNSRTICNIVTTWKGISPAACKGWYSQLLTAKVTQSPITIQYNDSLTACSQQLGYGDAGAPWAMW